MKNHIKFKDVKTKAELKTRINNGTLSVGCWWPQIRKFVEEKPFPGCQKITVIYSSMNGTGKTIRYI